MMRRDLNLSDVDRFLAMVARLQEKADRAGYRGPDDIEEYPSADRAASEADRRHQFDRE